MKRYIIVRSDKQSRGHNSRKSTNSLLHARELRLRELAYWFDFYCKIYLSNIKY